MTTSLPRRSRAGIGLAAVLLTLSAPAIGQNGKDEEAFRVAMGLVQRGMHDDAADQLASFLGEQPDHRLAREAWYRLGVCQQELGRSQDAIKSFATALSMRGPFALVAECRYRLGNTLKGERDYGRARSQYRKLLEAVPEDHYLRVPALYAAGECSRELGELEDALESFTATADAAGDDQGKYGLPALYQAGFVLLRLDRFGPASTAFGHAAARFPEHEAAAECRYLEGDAAFRANDVAAAERAYEQAVRAGGEFVDDAVMGLAWCRLERDQEAEALALFRAVTEDHPNSPHAAKARLEAGRILYRKGEIDAALEELAPLAAADVAPELRTGALELQALGLLDRGEPQAAIEHIDAALSLVGDDATRGRLHHGRGEALAVAERWEEALAAYTEAEALASDQALLGDVLYGESLALHKLGHYPDSLARARTLLERCPDHRLAVNARFSVAENLFALERYPEADAAYEKVPPDSELAATAAFKRAWCSFLAGDMPNAAQRFDALTEPPTAVNAEESLSLAALAHLNAGASDAALQAADRYRARYAEGAYLARTERVAARVLRERGDLSAAAKRLAHAAKAETSEEQAARDVLERAEVVFRSGDFAQAQNLYESQRARGDATGARSLEGLAWCAFELGDDETCLARAREALAHPEVGEAARGLRELELASLHRARRWSEATAVATEYLASQPDDERSLAVAFGLGVAHTRGGEHGTARRIFARLAQDERFARQDELHYEWAWASRRDGDEVAALRAFAVVAERSDDVDRKGEANLHLGLAALTEQDHERARRHFDAVEGEYRAQAAYRSAFSWLETGDPERGLALAEEVVGQGEAEPLYLEALFLAGECELRLERFEGAASRYGALLAAAPDHQRSQVARLHGGRSLVESNHAGQAAGMLENYLQRGGGTRAEQAEANLWLGRARAARGEHDRAEAAFLETTKLSEGEFAAEAQFRIGEVRRSKGDFDGAVDAFVKLSILYGHDDWVRRGLLQAGLCYEELQQPIKAAKFFRELTERYPDTEEASIATARIDRNGGPR